MSWSKGSKQFCLTLPFDFYWKNNLKKCVKKVLQIYNNYPYILASDKGY